jgi:hypothetical protein
MLGDFTGKKSGIEGIFKKFKDRSSTKITRTNPMITVLKYKPNYNPPKHQRKMTTQSIL